MAKNPSLNSWLYWGLLLLAVAALKTIIYALDPQIQFFMGDSASYIYSSVSDWIPYDRSYTYGWFIAKTTLNTRILDGLVWAQVGLSALTCMLLACILVVYLRCSRTIAAIAALLCALEPIQLMFERYVMAETISLFVFAVFLLSLLQYLRGGNPFLLVTAAALGVLDASLRTAYLPVILGLSLLALSWRIFCQMDWSGDGRKRWQQLALAITHVALFVAPFMGFQAWEASPREHSHTGFFLLSAWSPLLASQDQDTNEEPEPLLAAFTRDLDCKLNILEGRMAQLWFPDCLIGRIKKHFPDQVEANDYAMGTAMSLLARDPIGVLKLGIDTWFILWDPSQMQRVLGHDRGTEPLPQDFVDMVYKHYFVDISGRNTTETLSNQVYTSALWWHYWVILSPLVLMFWWLLTLDALNPYSLLITAAAVMLLVVVTALVVGPSIRFFHPVPWLSIIGVASAIDRILHRRSGQTSR